MVRMYTDNYSDQQITRSNITVSFKTFPTFFSDESKFYISFENSLCDDYATEKFFHVQTFTTAVPIVMGETKEW
jgi:hypothetical protein